MGGQDVSFVGESTERHDKTPKDSLFVLDHGRQIIGVMLPAGKQINKLWGTSVVVFQCGQSGLDVPAHLNIGNSIRPGQPNR